MERKEGNLTEKDHEDLTVFLERILDAYKNGKIPRDKAVSTLAHVMGAIDIENIGEVRAWIGNKLNEGNNLDFLLKNKT